jgi:hypothetical protein
MGLPGDRWLGKWERIGRVHMRPGLGGEWLGGMGA